MQGTARRAEHGLLGALLLGALNARASCYDDGLPRVERAVGDDARETFHARQRVKLFNTNDSPILETVPWPAAQLRGRRNLLPLSSRLAGRQMPPRQRLPSTFICVNNDVVSETCKRGIRSVSFLSSKERQADKQQAGQDSGGK